MLVNIRSLKTGWQKWVDGKPADQRMGLVGDGFQPPRRNELGDDDEALWERMPDGSPRDPWQYTNVVVMMEPESGELYTFSMGSRGALTAIGVLSKAYGERERAYPKQFPLVELGVRSYVHSEYGEQRVPTFKVLEWREAPEELLNAVGLDYRKGAAMIRIFGYSPRSLELFDE